MIDWTELHMTFDAQGKPVGGEVTFTHVDPETEEVRFFAVDRIAKHIAQNGAKRMVIPIEPAFAHFLPRYRGLEHHRLARLTPQDVIDYPVMLAHMPGIANDSDEHLLIDGSHRYFYAWTLGWTELPAYEVPTDVWERFLVRFPKEIVDIAAEGIRQQVEEGKQHPSGIR